MHQHQAQPWERDNVKLLYVWLFFAAGFVGSEMKSLVDGSSPLFPVHAAPATSAAPARGGRGKKGGSSVSPSALVAGVLLFTMVFTGVLSYLRETQNHHVLYGKDERAVRCEPVFFLLWFVCPLGFCCVSVTACMTACWAGLTSVSAWW